MTTAREEVEKALARTGHYTDTKASIALAVAVAGQRVALGLLDLADAVREHTAAERDDYGAER